MTKIARKTLGSTVAALALILVTGSSMALAGGIKLEGLLFATNGGPQSGKAKHEEDRGRLKLSVQVEDLAANLGIDIVICGSRASKTTNAFGFADLNLDSKNGDAVPLCPEGNRDVTVSAAGVTLLAGTLAP